jgi:hypothetical protein
MEIRRKREEIRKRTKTIEARQMQRNEQEKREKLGKQRVLNPA